MREHIERLKQLLEMDVLEFLFSNDCCRLVYLMNDTVESFLIFQEYTITGSVSSGEIAIENAQLLEDEHGFLLMIREQNNNAFTIRFREIALDVHLYDYSRIGHFWVKEYEYLRLIEYRIAILHDKYTYLGPNYCSPKECELILLNQFPPLLCFPSASKEYWFRKDPWKVNTDSVLYAANIAIDVNDHSLYRTLMNYVSHPSKHNTKKIARMLTFKKHQSFVLRIMQMIEEASSCYPERSYGRERDDLYHFAWEEGLRELNRYQKQGHDGILLKEEPFVFGEDDFTYYIHLLLWKDSFIKRHTIVKSYCVSEDSIRNNNNGEK